MAYMVSARSRLRLKKALIMAFLMEDQELITVARRREHKEWIREWIRERELEDQCNTAYKLQRRLQECDLEEFINMLRMTPETFEYVLKKIEPRIQRKDTSFRPAISAQERLSMTIKYLATGEMPRAIARDYRVGKCTPGRVIKDTCKAIYEILGEEYIKVPSTEAEWLEVIQQFQQRWNYPGCIGAVDGKHVRMMKPYHTGSLYWNYKSFHSIILMAVVNANYEFLYLDVGCEGKANDGSVWKNCDFYQALEGKELGLPPPQKLPGTDKLVPCHLVADDAFAHAEYLQKPYAGSNLSDMEAIFNYRLSRARRIVENVFGIIASIFRVLKQDIMMNPESATDVVLAIATLHNILRKRCSNTYLYTNSVDTEDANYDITKGDWQRDTTNKLEGLERSAHRNSTFKAKDVRDNIAEYFMTPEGEVPWQYGKILNTHERIQALGS